MCLTGDPAPVRADLVCPDTFHFCGLDAFDGQYNLAIEPTVRLRLGSTGWRQSGELRVELGGDLHTKRFSPVIEGSANPDDQWDNRMVIFTDR